MRLAGEPVLTDLGGSEVIRKVFVPKAIFPVAAIVSQVVNFGLTLVPLFLLMIAIGAGFSLSLF